MKTSGTYYICTCCLYRGKIKYGLNRFKRKLYRAHERGIANARL